MIIRTAVLEGTVAEADRPAFDREMAGPVREAIAGYPGIREVRLRWPAETEPGAPAIHVQFDLYFDDLAAMHAALASPVRQAVRAALGPVMQRFQGRVYHLIMSESGPA